jgi:imidazolonepropionase-like amidohydrolase
LVHLPEGPEVIALRIEDGRASAVQDYPDRCESLDLPPGTQITPAFVESHSHLGLVEVSLESQTVDTSSPESDPIHADFSILDAYNPASSLIPVTRLGGVGAAIVVPSGGIVTGQSAAFVLAGDTQSAALLKSPVALHIAWGSTQSSRAHTLSRLRELFDDARFFRDHRADWNRNRLRTLSASHLDLEVLLSVIDGDLPLVVSANRASDIEALLRLVEEEEVRLVIVGGAEAWRHAETLARLDVAVMLDPLVYGPGSFDQLQARPDNAHILDSEGVVVILSTFSSHNARNLRQLAGNAVRAGMDPEAALAAITRNPAEVFGLEGWGRLDQGAQAHLAVWSGDPFEPSSVLLHLFLNGEAVELESRQSALFERYRHLGHETDGRGIEP